MKPNKIFFLVLLYILINNQLFSQSMLGFKAGYGGSRMFFLPSIKQELVTVMQRGINYQFLNRKKVGVELNLLYSQKSWIEITDISSKRQLFFNTIQFSSFSSFKLNGKIENGLFIKFGPFVSYAQNVKYIKIGDSNSPLINYDSLLTTYKKLDYGLSLGLSYKFKLGKGSLEPEIIYYQGLNDIMERNPIDIFQSLYQQLFFNISFLYAFGTAKKEEH